MGFFKKLFRKKKGGTFFGNLIRGGASMATGGILGSGAQLAKNDEKIARREQEDLVRRQLEQNKAFKLGSKLGAPFADDVSRITNSDDANKLKKSMIMDYLKKNWWKVLIPIILVVSLVVYLSRKSGSKGSKLFK